MIRASIDPPANDLVLTRCAHLPERVTVTLAPTDEPPKADVYLLSDTTGSMSDVISAVQAGLDAILLPSPPNDVAFGVGNYRDFPLDKNAYAFQHQLSPTTDLTAVRAAIGAWAADQGSDTPEGQLWALQQIAQDPAIGWRPDARRIVVWVGDEPGHDPVCQAISGGPADVTEATVTAALNAAGIAVVAVSTSSGSGGLDGDPAAGSFDYSVCGLSGSPGQATRITAATGGTFTAGIDSAQIAATLARLIKEAVLKVNNLSLLPSSSIAGFLTSVSPAAGYGPLPLDAEHVLPFDVVWDGTVESADGPQVFEGTLDAVADGVVVASKTVRITVPARRYHHVVDMLCGLQKPADKHGGCTTVLPGRYATAVTIYNPGPCPVVVEKRFAPLLLNGEAIGREPRTVPAKRFAKIELKAGEATMDDCCALDKAVRLDHNAPTLGVLDVVSDRALVVTALYTSAGSKDAGTAAPALHTWTVVPHQS
jgi:hypothetical protein